MRKAEREVEDKQKKLDRLEEQGLPMKSWNGLSWSLREQERIWRIYRRKRT